MGDAGRLDRAHLLEPEFAHVLEQPLAATQQDRDDVELELVVLTVKLVPAGRVFATDKDRVASRQQKERKTVRMIFIDGYILKCQPVLAE